MRVTLVYRGRYHVREALDLEVLVPLLRRQGHTVTFVYDPDTFGVTDNVFQAPRLARWLGDDERTLRRIAASRPDVVLFSVLTSTTPWCRAMAQRVKDRTGATVVFFGLVPSLVPERVVEADAVDLAVQGEVEGVVGPLLEALARGRGWEDVGSLVWRDRGTVRRTEAAPLVDLDALPLPDKSLFEPFVDHHYSYAAMVSRGCPYRCSFCEETCYKRVHAPGYFRRKGVDTVLRELVAGKRRTHFREVIFKDSYLSGDKAWLRALMARYRREIGVPFKCFCTVLGFDEETARLLKDGGCYSIEFGLQTWNDRLRRDVLDRRETAEDAFRCFALCDRVGLWYDVDHMFNLPGETRADHELGARCYTRLRRLSRVKVHYLMYLPTAPIVERAVASGDLPPDGANRVAAGLVSDFYDQTTGDPATRDLVAGFAALYKLLPLLPDGWAERLARGDAVRRLARIPAPAMAGLQGLNALRAGDLRFLAYLQVYPRKVLRTLARARLAEAAP